MKMLAKGVDISAHNSINWSKVDPKEIDFVIIRAGYGFNTQDKQFKTNIENAIKLGIPIGIYWFSYAGNVEHTKQEAEGCLNVISAYRKYITLPVFFDWEGDSYKYVVKTYKITPTKQLVSDMAIAFLETVKKAGYKVGNYNSVNYLNTYFDDRVKNNYDTWVAHVKDKYGNPLEKTSYKGEYTIHQYSWVGRPSGFNSNADMNYMYKDYIGGNSTTVVAKPTTPTYLVNYKTEQTSKVVSYNLTTQGDLLLSPHFKVKEFKSPDSNAVKIDNRLIWILEKLYADFNCSKLIINSGYRTPAYSVKIGGSSTDRHTMGQATDIKLFDKSGKIISAKLVCQKLCDYGNVFGIGYISEQSTHVDTRPRENIWFGDETKGVSLIKSGYTNFDGYFNGKKSLTVNTGTWNIRQLPNTAAKILCTVKGGTKYVYTAEMNGWVYIDNIKGWLSPKGFAKIK